MEWIDDYNIGVAIIDNQHKKLAGTITKLQDSLSTDYVNRQMAETLKFIVSYTQHHFSAEEEFMQSINYPDLNQQIKLHQKLIADVKLTLIKIKNKEQINPGDLIKFLMNWLTKHILEEDLKIRHYIKDAKTRDNINKQIQDAFLKETLINKLLELQKINQKSLINDEEYSNKKSYMIDDYMALQIIDSKAKIDDHFSLFDELLAQSLIYKKEYIYFKKLLSGNIKLDKILGEIKETVEKLEYLNTLTEQNLMTQKDFQKNREQLLDNI